MNDDIARAKKKTKKSEEISPHIEECASPSLDDVGRQQRGISSMSSPPFLLEATAGGRTLLIRVTMKDSPSQDVVDTRAPHPVQGA